MLKNDLPKVAEFKLEDKFHITGRGMVLAGQIISGTISAGNSVCIKYGNDLIAAKIQSVEIGHSNTPFTHFIGLLLGTENDHLEPTFEKLIGENLPII